EDVEQRLVAAGELTGPFLAGHGLCTRRGRRRNAEQPECRQAGESREETAPVCKLSRLLLSRIILSNVLLIRILIGFAHLFPPGRVPGARLLHSMLPNSTRRYAAQ